MLISSAIKFKRKGNDYFHIMCGKRHASILEEMFHLGIEYDKMTSEQGFMTDDFQFVERHPAIEVALASGQVSEKFAQTHYSLFSEDLWPD